ncbi:MAG: hypothetical protein Q7J52_16245 [Falsiroseomonas sp.]|nr:hypothetical protein [Falsiroseomonas sp.]
MAIAQRRKFHHDMARNHWATDRMISKSAPLAQLQHTDKPRALAATPMAERLSLRSCILIIAAISAVLWLGIVFFAGKLFG